MSLFLLRCVVFIPYLTSPDQSTAISVLSESSSIPQPPTGPVQIRQMDLSPFIV